MFSVSEVSTNPPVKVEFEGKIYKVCSARELLAQVFPEGDRPSVKKQHALYALYQVSPILVDGSPGGFSISWPEIRAYFRAVKARWTSDIPFVTQEEAERRASVCLTGYNGSPCPLHKGISGCVGCAGIAGLLIKTPGDVKQDVQGCAICGCYLKFKVWCGEDMIKADDRKLGYPDHCWVKKIAG